MSMIDRLEAATAIDRQFLRDVRDCQKLICAHDLLGEGLRLHRLMRARDLYIGAPPPANTDVKLITLQFHGMCQSKKCGQAIPKGSQAIWVHGVGTWHQSCWDEMPFFWERE